METGRAPAHAPRSIVVAQLAFIGDMVFSTPLFDAIAERWPAARLTVVGRPAALDVLLDHPSVHATIGYDKNGADRGLSGAARVAAAVRAAEPDLFLGVSRSGRTAWLALRSGAPRRVGFSGPLRRLAYDAVVDRGDARRAFPARPLALLGPLGGEPAPRPLHMEVGPARREASRAALTAAGWRGEPFVAVAPGAHYATKRWPERHVAAFLDAVRADGRARVALYGGPEEDALIARLLLGRPDVMDRRGIGIRGVAADLCHAAAFLGGDSGPAHIARALGVPAVVLHGPTDERPLADGRAYTVLSRSLACRPCSPHGDAVCPEGHHACLEEILPETVWATVKGVLRTT